jgi:hypothetical protein
MARLKLKTLVTFRVAIAGETDAILDAVAVARGQDKMEIAGEVLHEWARKTLLAAAIVTKKAPRKLLQSIGAEVRHG